MDKIADKAKKGDIIQISKGQRFTHSYVVGKVKNGKTLTYYTRRTHNEKETDYREHFNYFGGGVNTVIVSSGLVYAGRKYRMFKK